MTEEVAKIGFSADTSGLIKAKKDLEAIVPPAKKVDDALERVGKSTERMSDKMLAELQQINRNSVRTMDLLERRFKSMESKLNESIKMIGVSLNGLPFHIAKANAAFAQLGAPMFAPNAPMQRIPKAFQNVQMSTGNMFAQINDIGVTAAMGMAPMLIALQQGTQVAQGFVGVKLADAAKSIGGAFMALLSPTTLITIGLIAGVAALIQWGMSAFSAGEKTKSFAEEVKGLESAVSSLNNMVSNYSVTGLQEMIDKYRALLKQKFAKKENV